MTEFYNAWLQEAHPDLIFRRKAFQKKIKLVENTEIQYREIPVLPLVVHVIYRNNLQNISDEQIYSQIASLNRDFRARNDNISTLSQDFSDLVGDAQVEFCLVDKDPSGNPTNGIIRQKTDIINIGLKVVDGKQAVFFSELGGDDGWNQDEYINIYVCEIGNGRLGFASFPGSVPASEDGIVIDYRSFGTIGTAESPSKGGKTLTHELGHYFDLYHIWGTVSGDCTNDDGIEDTPLQDYPNTGCPSSHQVSCGSFDLYNDFMDYTNDDCLSLFTKGQVEHMKATLYGVREGLVNAGKCSFQASSDLLAQIEIQNNPTNDFFYISMERGNIFEVQVTILDLYGRIVRPEQKYFFPGKYSIDVKGLVPSVYFLYMKGAQDQLIRRVLVLE